LFVLHVTRGPDQGKKLPLEPGKTYTIGCNEDASLVLSDPLVLKGHCSLEVSAAGIILRNHTATAGTFVGDQKVSQAALKPNATFRVGATVLGIAAAPAPAAPPKAPPPPDPLIGRIVGGYKLNELVGAGGMGKVYRATQLSLHRDVAFKVLRDQHVKDKGFRDLFINEARSAAQLVHPNVVQVYDAGVEGDLVFFSMEFLGQGSIEEILEKEKRIPWPQAILQVLEAAHGLQYAESKGIVHRDIKPDNLMLNEDGRVKIADLGLAKRGEGAEDAGVIGTPHFIPPEQALGKDVDHRADIYSLGATFYRMITGQTLFTGKTAKEIVLKHIKEPPPAASSVDETVPDDLDLVIAKMLAKDPAQRYQSATEVIAALEEVCAHHGIKGAIIKRGVGKRVLIPLVLLLLAAGGAVYYFANKGISPEEKARQAKLQEDKDAADAAAAQAAADAKAAERDGRRKGAKYRLEQLQNSRLSLQLDSPLEAVYDDPKTKAAKEYKWLDLAKELDRWADEETTREFEEEEGLSSKAKGYAAEIRKELDKWNKSADDRRENQEAKLKEAKEIDAKLRGQLAELRAKRKYEEAWNLCNLAGAEKPSKDDPFGPVTNWVWVSPVDPDLKPRPALEFGNIKEFIDQARVYYRDERPAIIKEAGTLADGAFKEAALPPDADQAAIDAAIKRLEEVRKFRDEDGPPVPEIQALIGTARDQQVDLERIVTQRTTKLLGEDRVRVRDVQRRASSLDPESLHNYVMACDFPGAIGEWQRQLAQERIKTDLYRRFVKERIAMLQWCEFLFGRFHVDVILTANGAEPKPLKLLALDSVPFPDGDLKDVELNGKDVERYKLSLSKLRNRQSVFAYGEFPMDWVYNSVFLHLNEPRWVEPTAEVRFALGAFCFETMQYKDAARHFDEVVKANDERLGAAARSLKARAELETKARAAYEALLREFDAATTSADMEALKKKVEAYRADHEGTIFYLDVMDITNPADAMKIEFYKVEFPEVPQAPPPPEPKS
jgi:tRNA A-37 threonylcarbamoyl transferase component Bud32